MEPLNLPQQARVYLDTVILIYSVEAQPHYRQLLYPLWRKISAGDLTAFTSALALLEVLVVPLRNQDRTLVADYETLLLNSDLQLFPVDTTTLRQAAQLRAATSLRTPDAIHAAAALQAQCTHFLTNDRRFQQVTALPNVMLLDHYL